MAIPKIQTIRNENYVLWGKKCACGYRVRVGHNVMSHKLPGGEHTFIEHVDCLLDYLNGGGRGLRRPGGTQWSSCAMGVQCRDLFNRDVSYWRATLNDAFGIHEICLKHLLTGWERSVVPILQKDIDQELATLTA